MCPQGLGLDQIAACDAITTTTSYIDITTELRRILSPQHRKYLGRQPYFLSVVNSENYCYAANTEATLSSCVLASRPGTFHIAYTPGCGDTGRWECVFLPQLGLLLNLAAAISIFP